MIETRCLIDSSAFRLLFALISVPKDLILIEWGCLEEVRVGWYRGRVTRLLVCTDLWDRMYSVTWSLLVLMIRNTILQKIEQNQLLVVDIV
jgi:hypothetical protein